MKNIVRSLAVLLALTCFSVAQDSSRSSTLRGCLNTSNGAYTLTDQSGVTFRLRGKSDLAQQVGHEVEVRGQTASSESSAAGTGTTTPTTSGNTTASGNTSSYPAGSASKQPSASAGPNAAPEFAVSEIKMISDRCASAPGSSPQH